MRKRGRLKARVTPPEGTAITKGGHLLRRPGSLALMAILVALVALASTAPNDDGDPDGTGNPGGPGRVFHEVGIPLENITGEASFFTYRGDGPEVRFFAVTGGDGLPRLALDACDTCYTAGLGFHQVNGTMRCASCGKVFPIDGIGSGNLPGGCWPSFVPSEVDEGMLIIDSKFLDSKGYMFE